MSRVKKDKKERAMALSTLDLKTGERTWTKILEETYTYVDASSILVYNDTIIVPTRDHIEHRPYPFGEDGNNQMTVLSLSGDVLWNYTFDDVLWNFMPQTTGAGDILIGSMCGLAWRFTFDGKLMWKFGAWPGHGCSCGGGTVGPNGIFYLEFNHWEDHNQGPGVVVALRVSDGSVVWGKYFGRFHGYQYPSVGRVGPKRELAVVAGLGQITGHPPYPYFWLVPDPVKDFVWWAYVNLRWFRAFFLWPARPKPNMIVALRASDGEEIWRFEEEEWDHAGSKNDEADLLKRLDYQIDGEMFCLPDPWGMPLISGDGTVYGSSGHNGDLTAIRDDNLNGIIEPTEVKTFKTGVEFLNSPSLAPGMLVAAPCWGPMYVFKDKM